jgi:lipopolysaccharide/colanic/teichoic acid biosynthesis glycosyltransferase
MTARAETDSSSKSALEQGETSGGFFPFIKRAFDIVFSFVGLICLLPFGALIALAIKLSDGGRVFYLQQRVGRFGKLFNIVKFRTMVVNADRLGPSVTQDEDPRITKIGRLLRKTKLDELPQLWNVLTGSMSFVGPRPEVSRYVARYTPEQRQILNYKPGITDLATLVFRDEEALLRGATDVEEFYVKHCIPRKFHLNLQYARRANLIEDVIIIAETLCPYWLSVMFTYAVTLALSLWLSYGMRFDFVLPPEQSATLLKTGPFIVLFEVLLLSWRKQFVGLLSYFDLHEVKQLLIGLGLSSVALWLMWYVADGRYFPSRSIILMNFVVSFMLIGGTRLFLRLMRESRSTKARQSSDDQSNLRVGIIGAGEMGLWMVRQLNFRRIGGRRVEALFDDDPDKWHKHLHGVEVVGMPECVLDGSWNEKLDEVIVVLPEASGERLEQIKAILASANIRSRIMPSVERMLGDSRD